MRSPLLGPLSARVFDQLAAAAPAVAPGGAGGSSALDALLAQDASLRRLHAGEWPPPPPASDFVRRAGALLRPPAPVVQLEEVDVAVCGGTLGLLLACALQLSGHRVAVVEAGPLRGRDQDWNTSADELRALVDAGLIDEADVR